MFYLLEGQRRRDGDRNLPVLRKARAEPGQRQQPGTPNGFLKWLTGTEVLELSSALPSALTGS